MTAGQFHRPKPAEVVNAFERISHKTPSIFCTPKDVGVEARKLGRMTAKGQANIQASADRINAVIPRKNPPKEKKQVIAYSKAAPK